MKKYLLILAVIRTAAFFASCASAPKEAPGAPDFLVQARTAADDSRNKAVAIKASVSAKELFDQAESDYVRAQELETAEDYQNAAEAYTASSGLFTAAWADANEKREAALDAMSRASTEREASEKAILEAEEAEAAALEEEN